MGQRGFGRREGCVHSKGSATEVRVAEIDMTLPIEALKMCWSIFQRVLGWKRAVSFRNAVLVSRLCDRNTSIG